MAIAKRTGLIVAGMHRSGTSAVARLINLLGADMARDIVPANAWNEDGHWESHPIITLHDRMLETFDARWNSLSGIGEEGLPSIGERRQLVDAIKSVVVEQYGDS